MHLIKAAPAYINRVIFSRDVENLVGFSEKPDSV